MMLLLSLLRQGSSSRSCRFFSSSVRIVSRNVESPSATTINNGVRVSLVNADADCYIPSPWLWINDPRNVHKQHGQKMETSLSFHRRQARIVSAECCYAGHNAKDDVAPPLGSLHPHTGMYTSTASAASENDDEADWMIQVEWEAKSDVATSSVDTERWFSYYHLKWLQDLLVPKEPTPGTKTLRSGTQLDYVKYSDVVDAVDSQASYDVLHAVMAMGAAIVDETTPPDENTSDDDSPVGMLGRALSGGHLSHGHLYDDVFHVRTVPDAINIAYTSVALPPHQDLSYYESPPGLQLLHCVQQTNVVGGSSILIDALAAARELRYIAPDLFHVLSTVPATFMKQRQEADMMYRRPHIRLGSDGVSVVSVHWSPPFEGPLLEIGTLATAEEYYLAHAAFTRMLDKAQPPKERLLPQLDDSVEQQLVDYAHAMTWEYQLRAGQVLVFNNLRMLHGRTAFRTQHESGLSRHLMGCYTNIDESLSEYRRLRRMYGTPNAAIPMVGNGSATLLV